MDSPKTPDFERTLAAVSRALTQRGFAFMIVGGQAVLLHGEPRLTQDVDITLAADPDHVSELLEIAEAIQLQILPADPLSFVRSTYVLPVLDPSGIRIDFRVISRSSG